MVSLGVVLLCVPRRAGAVRVVCTAGRGCVCEWGTAGISWSPMDHADETMAASWW